MEKEQKKLLLVAISVGVFLLVTVTVAIIMVTSKTQTNEMASFTAPRVSPGIITPVDTVNISYPQQVDTQETNNIEVDSVDNAESAVAVDSLDGDNLTIQIPLPRTAAVPDNTEVTKTATPLPVVTVPPASVRQTTTPTAQPAAPAATRPAATTTTTSTTARPPTQTRAINDYWIQTGAFKALVRAEDAKELLSSKGLTSIIETRIVNNETFYRVRLGPYTSEREANNWLSLVKSIDGFGESQLRQTVRQQ